MFLNDSYINGYEALLFDLDGTLADSMLLHNQAWISTLNDLGYSITSEILFEYAGITNQKIVELFNHRFHWKLDAHSTIKEKEKRFFDTIEQVRPIESVISIVQSYAGKKPMAVVSGGAPEMVRAILKAICIESYFPVLVCAGDTLRGKPYPDPFLQAARLLGVVPEKCLVFEDGDAGIAGAKQANMGIIKVGVDQTLQILVEK